MSVVDTLTDEAAKEAQRQAAKQDARIAELEELVIRHERQIAYLVDGFEYLRPKVNALDGAAQRLTPSAAFTAADIQDTRAMREIIAQARSLKARIKDFTHEQAVGVDGLVPVKPVEVHA